jgi:DNA modification methylase
MSVRIMVGDCRERLKELPDNSVDSACTDPPYHLTSIVKRFGAANAAPVKTGKTGAYVRASRGFMGQQWDGGDVAFQPETWEAVYRVLKPGGFLVAFSGCRTYHRMATAIEAAGFEVRDMLSWNFGSGFPKSHNITKALAASGLACSCHKTIVSHHHVSSENLRDLQAGLAAHDALPIDAQSDLRAEVLGATDRHETSGPSAESATVVPMRDVRDDGSSAAVSSSANGGCLLQRVLPVEDLCGSTAADGGEHEGAEGHASLRTEEPRLEGRGLPQAAEGELQGRPLCASAGVGEADGAQGRLHHGASARDGSDVRLPADANGSGQPHRPQPGEQPSEQLGVVADERGPQAWGGWPVCPGCRKPIVPEGYGTALKPAHEPICLARKPLVGTVAGNMAAHGTGALNIDGCRIGTDGGTAKGTKPQGEGKGIYGAGLHGACEIVDLDKGRWPANIIHDGSEEVLAAFPEVHGAGAARDEPGGGTYTGETGIGFAKGGAGIGVGLKGFRIGDSGSAARFFYCAKATTDERGEGNNHPTVKPVDLMRWLCRLVTPRGGTVLDPFAGSGSTLIAADAEQFDAIGCELSPDYAAIAEQRVRKSAGLFAQVAAA